MCQMLARSAVGAALLYGLMLGLGDSVSWAQAPTDQQTAESRATTTLELPGIIDDIVVGGSGKYLVAHLTKDQTLAIIEVKQAKIVRYITLPSPDALFAAGAEKLYVVSPQNGLVQRFSLRTFEKEAAIPLPRGFTPGTMTMGHASLGPILFGSANLDPTIILWDGATMHPWPVNFTHVRGRFECHADCVVRAAANGQVFTSSRKSGSPTGVSTLLVSGPLAEAHSTRASVGMLCPNFDGSRIYTGGGIFNERTNWVAGRDGAQHWAATLIPGVTGPFYLGLPAVNGVFGEEVRAATIALHLAGTERPLVTWKDRLPVRPSAAQEERYKLLLDKRVFLFPDAGLLVLLDSDDKSLELVALDLDRELEKSGIDYLFVTSLPPVGAECGKTLRYQVAAKSNQGGLKFELTARPDGMTIDPTGLLQWQVPWDHTADVEVRLTVSNASGQSVSQNFRLPFRKPERSREASPGTPAPADALSAAARPAATRPATTTIAPTAAAPSLVTPQLPPRATPMAAPVPASSPAPTTPPYAALIGKTRTWTDPTTGRAIEAAFAGIVEGKLKATREGGMEIVIPLNRLSREDLLWLLGGSSP